MSELSFNVKSGQGDYEVCFNTSINAYAEKLATLEKTLFVIDRNVFRLHEAALKNIYRDRPYYLLDANENEKTLSGCQRLLTWMQQHNATKATKLVVIGGGITQDVSCFSAHNYYRGIQWIYIPTTLLSMADSCIGAKSAINLNEFKNQLGAFHSPHKVFVATEFLNTLEDREIASGYGEITKLFLTGNNWQDFVDYAKLLSEEGLRNKQLPQLLKKSLHIKKDVIEVDEYEKDLRRILNYGHTFGHALESITHHEIPHGLAVLWGMDLVNYLSLKRTLLSQERFDSIRKLILRHFPFKLSKPVNLDSLLEASRKDKKLQGNTIFLILLTETKGLQITPCKYDNELIADIKHYVENINIYGT